MGFLAQEVRDVVDANDARPLNIVDDSNDDSLTIAKANFVPVLVKAIQELTEENELLKSEIAAIKAHIGM